MEGLVIRLLGTLFFGPPPKNKDHLKHLKERLGVKLIINICPTTNQRTGYTALFTPKDKDWKELAEEKEMLFLNVVKLPFDLSDFVAQGRTKGLQQESLAQHYVQYAKMLKEKHVPKDNPPTLYIHGVNGNMEEAYISFALWYMLADQKDLPSDLLQWIKDEHYEWLFDDDADKKQLLTLILNEVQRGQKKTNFFKRLKDIK